MTHSVLAVGTLCVSSVCLCRTCSSTAGGTPMSEEQRFRWAERLFRDLNFLPQMGQSGTPGGGAAGALSSLSSKHLQRGIGSLSLTVQQSSAVSSFCYRSQSIRASVMCLKCKQKYPDLLRCCVRPSGVMCDRSLWQI